MKINESQRLYNLSAYQHQETKRSAESKPALRRDAVHISPEAKQFLLERSEGSDQVHLEKIEQLKERVESGTYHVDSSELADRLLPFLIR